MLVIAPGAEWLNGRTADVYSQFGEDGLIAAIFERIGIKSRWCFEVGAADGVFFSNTKLWRDKDWDAVLIEADADSFAKLKAFQSSRVRCVHERIAPDSLDRILAEHNVPDDLDLGVIDVDGQDYWIFNGLEKYRPRLLTVEFSYRTVGKDVITIPMCDPSTQAQASYEAIRQLGLTKGYVPVCATDVNLLFVRDDSWV